MALVLETGGGVQNGNSYVTAAFVLAYLTERNRETENSWSTLSTAIQEAHCIAATDYIDTRWGSRFMGVRAVYFNGLEAVAQVTYAGQPSDAEVLVVGDATYTYKTALTTNGDFEILIGATVEDTIDNTVAAINEDANADIYSVNVIANQNANSLKLSATVLQLTAIQEGTSGDDITLTTTAGNLTPVAFDLGRDEGSQPLEFPRSSLFDRSGVRVSGIPRNLKSAAAEYAVRAASASLFTDPTVDATGKVVVGNKTVVGPIETNIQYSDGGAVDQLIKPYPAADRLLREYVSPNGTIRA